MKVEVAFHEHGDNSEIEQVLEARRPYRDATFVYCDTQCKHCKASPVAVAGFQGTRVTQGEHTYEAAGCRDCRGHLGTIKVTLTSIFGEEEDRAVLNGRARVYYGD